MAIKDLYGDDSRARHGAFLLELATAAGTRPRPSVNGRYSGFCPFHGDPANSISRDLSLDVKQGRFNCSACRVNDYTSGFAARIWRMSRRDAMEHIEASASPTMERPLHHSSDPRRQNTALLTRAMTHYRDNLNYSLEAIWYLATLGLTIDQANEIGLGWCQRDGTAETVDALKRDGVKEEELRQSSLLNQRGQEQLEGCIVLSDRDYSGGVVWMAGIPPKGPDAGEPWPDRPPPARLLRGWRPYLFGLHNSSRRSQRLYIADDYRFAIRLQATGRNATCTIGQAQPSVVARYAATVHPREIAVVYFNESAGQLVASALTDEQKFPPRNVLLGNAAIVKQVINDRTSVMPDVLQEKREQATTRIEPTTTEPEPQDVPTQETERHGEEID